MEPNLLHHNGRIIVELNFRGADQQSVLSRIEEFKPYILRQARKSLLVLTDVSGCVVNKTTVEAFKQFTTHNKHHIIASAVVGLSGGAKVFLNSVNYFSKRDIKLFDDVLSAKNWLASFPDKKSDR
jgi:hypothetical protein